MSLGLFSVLTLIATVGRAILRWRRVAGAGFGLGAVNTPALLACPIGNILVWVVGQALFWGAAFLIFALSTWYWTALALFGAGVIAWLLVFVITRREVASARESRDDFQRRYGGMSAVAAAMRMHRDHGSISQKQYEEFLSGGPKREQGDGKENEGYRRGC